MKIQQLYFFVLLFLVCIFFIDIEQGDNSLTRAFTVISLVEKKTFSIDSFKDQTGDIALVKGHYYSDKAPFPTLVAVPFYALFSWLIQPESMKEKIELSLRVGTFFCATLPFFIVVGLILIPISSSSAQSNRHYVILSIFSCFIYTYASAFWGHMLTALFLLLCYQCIQNKKYYYAGLAGGAAFASEYMYAIVMVCWVLYLLIDSKRLRSAFEICVGCLPGILLVMLNNFLITSNPFEMTYKSFATDGFEAIKTNYGFSFPMLKALYGLSFSDYRGIFIYLPILAPLVFFSYKNKRNGMLFFSFIIFFLALSSFHFWHGGWAYGPRYLLPLCVVLLYAFCNEITSLSSISKWLILYLLCFLMLHFFGRITTGNSVPTLVYHPFLETVLPRLKHLEFNPNNVLTICFNIPPILANAIWLLMLALTIYFSKIRSVIPKKDSLNPPVQEKN